ncbi:MAG: helix-turn-helix transcriptional regulator [Firmicutes bacterium]|nr:helix-turn-helix transcriptional regulator [Bacillota bacterium]
MIREKELIWGTNYGKVKLCIKDKMDEKNISISKMSRLSGLKYDVVLNYYYNRIHIYNADILAKFCYVLDCPISTLVIYEKPIK